MRDLARRLRAIESKEGARLQPLFVWQDHPADPLPENPEGRDVIVVRWKIDGEQEPNDESSV